MKVGDYVRIKNTAGYCYIGELININEFREPSMKYCIDIQADDFIFVSEDMITKFGEIIDVIEKGDYVNGYKVSFKDKDIEPFVQCDYTVQNGTTKHYRFSEKAIHSIITHEQMDAMEFKI